MEGVSSQERSRDDLNNQRIWEESSGKVIRLFGTSRPRLASGYPGLRCAAPWADLGPSLLGLICILHLGVALHPGLIWVRPFWD